MIEKLTKRPLTTQGKVSKTIGLLYIPLYYIYNSNQTTIETMEMIVNSLSKQNMDTLKFEGLGGGKEEKAMHP